MTKKIVEPEAEEAPLFTVRSAGSSTRLTLGDNLDNFIDLSKEQVDELTQQLKHPD